MASSLPMIQLEDLPVEGVEHRFVRAGEVSLHVASAGQGPPLLLLHGWPQHWWCWRKLIPELAREHRVIVPDLRGWGWSDAPPGSYRKSLMMEDIRALLDAEGIGRTEVIGHDWGGYVAFLLALAHPERVSRMVALDIVPPWPARPGAGYLRLPAFLSYQVTVGMPVLGPRTMTSSPAFIRAIIRTASGSEADWSDEDLDVYADVLRQPPRARASSACYRTFLTREAPAALRSGLRADDLTVPTLLVMGSESFLRRTFQPQPSRNLEVTAIPGAGHFLPEEAPEQVLELAGGFLPGG